MSSISADALDDSLHFGDTPWRIRIRDEKDTHANAEPRKTACDLEASNAPVFTDKIAMPGDATIMESEEFSMVSAASLDSHRTASERRIRIEALRPLSGLDQLTTPVMPDRSTQRPTRPHPVLSVEKVLDTSSRSNVVNSGKILQDIVRTPDPTRRSFRESLRSSRRSHDKFVHENDTRLPMQHPLPTPESSSSIQTASLVYPDLSRSIGRAQSIIQPDPMSWIATAPSPDDWSSSEHAPQHTSDGSEISHHSDVQSHSHHSHISQPSQTGVDETGVFWRANRNDLRKDHRTKHSMVSELRLPDTLLDEDDEDLSLLHGTMLEKPPMSDISHLDDDQDELTSPETSQDYETDSEHCGDTTPDTASEQTIDDDLTETQAIKTLSDSSTQNHSGQSTQGNTFDSVEQQLAQDLCRLPTTSFASPKLSPLPRGPTRTVPVNFGDYHDPTSLPAPVRDYPRLFDNSIPHLTPRRATSEADDTLNNTQTGLASRAWSIVSSLVSTTNPVNAAPKFTAPPASPPRSTIPDMTLRLQRKYGLLSKLQPFTYAHIRTLHRMQNSVRHHSHSTIIPTSGLLSPCLAAHIQPKSCTSSASRIRKVHLYALQAFIALLLPQHEIDHFERNGAWGDDEALRSKARDGRSRPGNKAVFGLDPDPDPYADKNDRKDPRVIRVEWLVQVVESILDKEAADLARGKPGGGTVVKLPPRCDSPLSKRLIVRREMDVET